MASAFSHAAAAVSLGAVFPQRQLPRRWWLVGMTCAVIPDVDVIGFRFGVHYGDLLGHRGITHSLVFAAALSVLIAICVRSRRSDRENTKMLVLYLFVATASHGGLDALTNGGLGVAFFAPFSSARYFLPFRPIEVSPISVEAFFTHRGMEVLKGELLWIWLPFSALAMVMYCWRRATR